MISCQHCHHEVAAEAVACPKCGGRPGPEPIGAGQRILMAIGGIIFAGVLSNVGFDAWWSILIPIGLIACVYINRMLTINKLHDDLVKQQQPQIN